MAKKEILNYINVYRAIAMIMIVAGHSFYLKNPTLKIIFNEIFSNGTVLFIFISGFLFQYLSYKFEYFEYLKKKFVNVVSPYLITSVIGIIICFLVPSVNPFYHLNKFLQICIFIPTGYIQNKTTWYIPVICVFFLFSWILIKFEKKFYKYLPLFLLITISRPRYPMSDYIISTAATYWDKAMLLFKMIPARFVHYFSIYVLGMYYSKHLEKIETLYKYRYWLLLLMFTITILDIVMGIKLGWSNGSVSKIILTLVVLGYLKHYDEKIKSWTGFNNLMDLIAKYSFGIFFIHGYLLKIVKLIYLQMGYQYEIYIVDLKTCIVFILTSLLMFVVGLFGSLLVLYYIKKLLSRFGIENHRAIVGA